MRWKPCKRREFIRRLRAMGFTGPHSGTKHQFLLLGDHRLALPQYSEYSVPQLKMMLREVSAIIGRGIELGEWERL